MNDHGASPPPTGPARAAGQPATREHRVPGAARLLEGQVRKVLLPGAGGGAPTEVALCRLEGRLHAVDTLCPHEGGRFSAGELSQGRYLSCPLHLYKFDPRDGHAIDVPCAPARVYDVREEGRDAVVTIRSGDAPPPG